MLAATSANLRHSGRKALHPKTNHDPPKSTPTPSKTHQLVINESNKENIPLIDASLAEELTAVKQKLERLRVDKDKTHKLLQERDRILQLQMTELLHRGHFQKELEIEVDRLYRLRQASMRMSPIRSLRVKEFEKKSKEPQLELYSSQKSGESKEDMMDESNRKESPALSIASSSASTTSASSKMLPFPLRLLSLESDM